MVPITGGTPARLAREVSVPLWSIITLGNAIQILRQWTWGNGSLIYAATKLRTLFARLTTANETSSESLACHHEHYSTTGRLKARTMNTAISARVTGSSGQYSKGSLEQPKVMPNSNTRSMCPSAK